MDSFAANVLSLQTFSQSGVSLDCDSNVSCESHASCQSHQSGDVSPVTVIDPMVVSPVYV